MIEIVRFPFSADFERPIQRKWHARRFQPYSISEETMTPTTWSVSVDLSALPTQKEDLKITKDKSKRELQMSGSSRTTNEKRGIKIESTHSWTKTLTVPETVDFDSVTSKFNGSTLVFSASRQLGTQIPVDFVTENEEIDQ